MMWGKVKIDKADKIFADYVKKKADYKCAYCGKDCSENPRGLHLSHYWGRGHEAGRFDLENCDALCAYHHSFLGHGEGRDIYKTFKIKQLGQKKFKLMDARDHGYCKKDRKLMYIIFKKLFDEL